MFAVADTTQLTKDRILSPDQAHEIELRARELMVSLAINTILCFGILAATLGLIFFLADPLSVAVFGFGFALTGGIVLKMSKSLYRMFGNASTLIGVGMLLGGASIELMDKYDSLAAWVMVPAGTFVALVFAWAFRRNALSAPFAMGAIFVMGVAMHLIGIAWGLDQAELSGAWTPVYMIYAAIILAVAGWYVDVRLISALAIVPFAQALDTGTIYFRAAYVFYSPESTLSILQMAALMGVCLWITSRSSERMGRHSRIVGIMAFIVANLCALVGSLWGDVIGESYAKNAAQKDGLNWEAYREAMDVFRETAFTISEGTYAAIWALLLLIAIIWAAHYNRRGIFNAALTFAAIHAYTQMFETFGAKPLAFVIAGLAAIPLAWGLWRANQWFVARKD